MSERKQFLVNVPEIMPLRALRIQAGEPEGPGGGSDHQGDHGLAVGEARPKLKRPPLYKVVLLNDDYTPMEFVVEILQRFFRLDRTKATQIMLNVHTRGKGICGVFTYEIAETKAAQVTDYAREHNHPLLCQIEEA